MKFNTWILIGKGICFFIVGFFTPMSSSLAQYANTGDWPAKIVWWGVVIPACMIGGASALQAYFSTSFATYKAEKAVGNGGNEEGRFLASSQTIQAPQTGLTAPAAAPKP